MELESGLPVLTCRRCEVRRGPRRGVDGGLADIIASHWAEQGNLYHFGQMKIYLMIASIRGYRILGGISPDRL